MTIQAGQSVRYRYRIIVHSGDVKTADIAALWSRYAGGK